MREKVFKAFRYVYGQAPAYIARAPGRANLIGEHTDYHEGFVMPLALDRAVYVAFSPRDDGRLHVHSLDFENQSLIFGQDQLEDRALPHWASYVQGAWWLMRGRGWTLPGADMVIGSTVPLGGGMSSSAAIGVAMIEVLYTLKHQTASQTEKALLAVEIEHQFMGVPCGVMDQMASAAALDRSAMLLDCRSLESVPVRLPNGLSVLVLNTMKARQLAEGGYKARREESESAAQLMGVKTLRDADLALLEAQREALGDLRYRRARHVITENARTWQMKAALEAEDLPQAGALLNASHASLRDDYEVSVRELDVMSELARTHEACLGARMMGGGFGGCAIGLVRDEGVEDFLAYLEPRYRAATGLKPEFYICQAAQGSTVENL
jgi:galactokinase